MNETKLLPDDPKLTAYALGELEGADRAAVEAALRDDLAAHAAVEEIRAMTAHLEGALAMEAAQETKPATAGSSLPHAAIIPGRDPSKLDGGPLHGRAPAIEKLIRFPQFYYVMGGLAAACFALMVALRTPKPAVAPRKSYTALTLAPAVVSAEPVSTAVSETKEQVADPTAPVEVAGASPTVQQFSNGNLSLMDQTKALAEEGRKDATRSLDTRLRAPTGGPLTILNAPSAGQIAIGGSTLRKTTDNTSPTVERVATEGPSQPAAQLASTGQSYPADEKLLVTARKAAPFAALRNSPAPTSSLFEEAAKQGALAYGGDSTLTGAGSVTFGIRSDLGSSQIRGSNTYAPTQNHESAIVPRWGAPRAASADRYAELRDNEFLGAAQNQLSTFSIDVDTASYSNVRRFLRAHQRPPRDAVRIEELVNYFPYRYAPPTASEKRGSGFADTKAEKRGSTFAKATEDKEGAASPSESSLANSAPFAASLEVAEAPWAPTHRLVRIGLKGREVSTAARPAANLVFLLDVSGSMAAANRLPLVKESMRLLVGKLRADDRVAIVTYAGQSGLALASTPASQAREILEVLDGLSAGGSTNGGMGIQLAYDIAKANFAPGGINRVILCTDGDFNVGVTGEGDLTRLIEEKAKSGVALTALGFGMGNFKDAMIEKLADHGNGNYGYIDTRREAEKLLVEQVNGTLMTIAKDVKIQVDFNPARVASYRLLGYENRLLKKEDFNNDAADAGEIGAGHTVTAFYEIVPVGVDEANPRVAPVDELKYLQPQAPAVAADGRGHPVSQLRHALSPELLTVKMNYKGPAAEVSQRLEFPLTDGGEKFTDASADFKFAAAVAGFGMILRESPYKGTATLSDVVKWAEAGSTEDAGGYRAEFIELVREAESI